MKVCKFGGTSMANAECIKRVRDIVLGDNEVRYVVVSAPGKRAKDDIKVTDLLYKCHDNVVNGMDVDMAFAPIEQRFNAIKEELNLTINLETYYTKIKTAIYEGANIDYIASRGEYLSALITADYLNFEFIDAADFVVFNTDGTFEGEITNDLCSRILSTSPKAVIPGFYGKLPNGEIKTFSRGGSDISGAIVARAVNASMYENWTDVDGFMKCDPRIVKNPDIIDMVTYKELRELSYMGANVLHPDSVFPVRKKDICINIKNTFNPEAKGTLIVPTKKFFKNEYDRANTTITGIAGKKDFVAINIEKSMMNIELGFARKVLEILEKHGLSFEHMPTSIDTLTIIMERVHLDDELLNVIIQEIKRKCKADHIDIVDHLALIAVVGHGMNRKKGTASKVCESLSKADVNIRMIDQGSSELNIIVAVENHDFEKAISALYEGLKD